MFITYTEQLLQYLLLQYSDFEFERYARHFTSEFFIANEDDMRWMLNGAGMLEHGIREIPRQHVAQWQYSHIRTSGSDPAGNRTRVAYVAGDFDSSSSAMVLSELISLLLDPLCIARWLFVHSAQ